MVVVKTDIRIVLVKALPYLLNVNSVPMLMFVIMHVT